MMLDYLWRIIITITITRPKRTSTSTSSQVPWTVWGRGHRKQGASLPCHQPSPLFMACKHLGTKTQTAQPVRVNVPLVLKRSPHHREKRWLPKDGAIPTASWGQTAGAGRQTLTKLKQRRSSAAWTAYKLCLRLKTSGVSRRSPFWMVILLCNYPQRLLTQPHHFHSCLHNTQRPPKRQQLMLREERGLN